MNISSILGFFIFAGVLYSGIFQNIKTIDVFYDTHALIWVLGGTLAAAFVAYPYSSLSRTVDYLLWGLVFKRKNAYLKISQDIGAARSSYLGAQTFITAEDAHPFFREAATFLMNRNIDLKAIEEILRTRSEYFKRRYEEDTAVLKAIAKYPPAFGLIGAITSVIQIMQKLDTSPTNSLGHLAALAVVSIFWGLAVSNFVILPLADSSLKAANEDANIRNLIIDGILLIRRRVTDEHFQAYLRGYLSVSDRPEFKVYPSKFSSNLAGLNPYKKVGPAHAAGHLPSQSTPGVVESVPASEQLPTIETILGITPSPQAFKEKNQPYLQVVSPLDGAKNEPQTTDDGVDETEVAADDTVVTPEVAAEGAAQQAQSPENQNIDNKQAAGYIESSIKIVNKPTDLAVFDFKDARKLMSEVTKVAANKKYTK